MFGSKCSSNTVLIVLTLSNQRASWDLHSQNEIWLNIQSFKKA